MVFGKIVVFDLKLTQNLKTHSKFEKIHSKFWNSCRGVNRKQKDMINFVYFGCGSVGSISKASINDLVPFTDDNVKILKLHKIKSAKLKNTLKVTKDYM